MFRKLCIDDFCKKDVSVPEKFRDSISIAFIDDEKPDMELIRSFGYKNIRHFSDFTDIADYESYDVVVCDIRGVGEKTDNTDQGGIDLAKNIKKYYPKKVVIQYSAYDLFTFGPNSNIENKELLDGFIKKGKGTADLVTKLDEQCSMFWNPRSSWEFIEKNLRSNGVKNATIAEVEHIFVKSLSKGNKSILGKISSLEINKETIANIIMIANMVYSFWEQFHGG